MVGVDPGFLLGGGASLRNGKTGWWDKRILQVNTKKKASSQGGVPPAPRLPKIRLWTVFHHQEET